VKKLTITEFARMGGKARAKKLSKKRLRRLSAAPWFACVLQAPSPAPSSQQTSARP
jgi:hypothetical protein